MTVFAPTLSSKIATRWLQLRSVLRCAFVRSTGVQIGAGTTLARGADVWLGWDPPRRGRLIFGANCRIENDVVMRPYAGRIALGCNVFVGPGSVIYGHGGVEIGDETLISMHCRIVSSNHAVPPPGTPMRSVADELRPTHIGRDVWLGAGVTVLGGVTIGDGCVVGAGAVVAADLPANSVAMGVPARITRQRT